MAQKSKVFVDIRKMKDLYEGLKTKAVVQVGVFKDASARKEEGLTNADLAMYHELGSPEHNLPARSMLKVPLADHRDRLMAPMKNKADLIAKKGGLLRLYKLIGVAGEKIVLEAFRTGGFGKWVPLKGATILAKLRRHGKSMGKARDILGRIYAGQVGEGILKDRGELMRSFSSRVRMGF